MSVVPRAARFAYKIDQKTRAALEDALLTISLEEHPKLVAQIESAMAEVEELRYIQAEFRPTAAERRQLTLIAQAADTLVILLSSNLRRSEREYRQLDRLFDHPKMNRGALLESLHGLLIQCNRTLRRPQTRDRNRPKNVELDAFLLSLALLLHEAGEKVTTTLTGSFAQFSRILIPLTGEPIPGDLKRRLIRARRIAFRMHGVESPPRRR